MGKSDSLYDHVTLNNETTYFVMDALYLNEIKDKTSFSELDKLKDLIDKIFESTYAPFAELHVNESLSKLRITAADVKVVPDSEIESLPRRSNAITTDTGCLIFVNESYLLSFLGKYDYDILTDSQITLINTKYWNDLQSHYPENDLEMLIAPGMDTNYDFIGSGIYRIVLK